MPRKCFLPPDLARRVPGHPTVDESFMRHVRQLRQAIPVAGLQIYTANGRQVEPGTLLTTLSDPRAKEAFDGLTATRHLLDTIGNSFGKVGLIATVHYGQSYDNAFWDGTQMVFGDGDGRYFKPFTGPIDVCAHELGHGVTGDLLDYSGQAGALNESMSDCVGVVTRQMALGLSLDDPTSWLIGYGLFTSQVKGVALRNMLNPGTAYNDDYLGKDPQPADMSGYVVTSDDDGGVHTNSGIPNRAFALACKGIGNAVTALKIWQDALHSVHDPKCTFEKFAKATISAAGDHADVVQGAWVTVGVLTATNPPVDPPSGGTADLSFLDPLVAARIQRVAKTPANIAPWMNHHFSKYFNLS